MSRTAIRLDAPRAMNAVQECAVLRATVRGGSAPAGVRRRLAALLNQLDAFSETIALLDAAPPETLSCDEHLLHAAALFARYEGDDTRRALVASEAAEALASNDMDRAAALAEQAKALLRLDRREGARDLLHRALALDQHNREACKRLTLDLLLDGDAASALALTDTLAARGAGHSRLFAARATALAALGDDAAARDTLALDTFLHQDSIDPPEGWDSLAAFNAALTTELLAHPAIRYERHGTASVQSWRIDSLVAGDGPLARSLLDRIVAATQGWADTQAEVDHPWVAAAPARASLRSWCVITEGAGYEQWHMHPFGWMSGVYYAAVPDAVAHGSGDEGCLQLGLSDGLVGQEASARVGFHRVRPRAGLLATFPSHSYHRTFPHQAAGKRVCVAFDIGPA